MSALQIPQATSRVVMLKLFLTGTTTAATGKTLAITIGKAGAAFGNPNAGATNATEVSNGWYKVTLDTTDTGTLGDLVVRGTATGCDDAERLFGVVKATNAGLTAVPDTAASTNASLLTSGTGTDQVSVSAGKVLLQATQTGVTIPTVTTLSNLPAVTTGWLTATGIAADAITAAKIADGAIDTATFATGTTLPRVTLVDTLTTYTGNTPQTGDAYTRIGSAGSGLTSLGDTRLANLDATVSSRTKPADTQAAVTLVTTTSSLTTLPSIPANWLTAAGLAADAASEVGTAVRTELTTELSRLDAAVTTRLASAGYTTPLDAASTRAALGLAAANLDDQLAAIAAYVDTEVAAIKLVTDQFAAAQAEPVAAPAANASPLQKIAWLAALARNKVTQTATTQTLRNDADSGAIAAAAVSDDGTTFVRGEWA